MANIFPRWSNFLPLKLAICAGAIAFGIALTIAVYGYGIPHAQPVGYQPGQPIPYSHEIHVNQLGMDCRYCHSFVEHGAHANVPSANVCFNCHGPNKVKWQSPLLKPLYDAMATSQVDGAVIEGQKPKPLQWTRVHKLGDYAYFNHSAHLNRGVSCQSCHGQVNKMKTVYQAEDLTMGWCLDCHRNPEQHLRPMEEVFNLDYDAEEWLKKNKVTDQEGLVGEKGKRLETQEELGKFLKAHWDVKPKESCATCHR